MKHFYRTLILLSVFCISATAANAAGHTVSVSTTNEMCFNQCNGSANATVSGGTGPFAYLWLPGNQTISSINNLCAGSYTVIVTDQSDGSTASANFSIISPPPLAVTTVSTNNPTCSNCNGSATIAGTGGVAPYTYTWWPMNITGPVMNNACVGTYTFMVMDVNGCSATNAVTLTGAAGPTISGISASSVVCVGGSATLTPSVSGGAPPYTYNWSNPGNTLNNPTAPVPVATPTVTTTYTLTVTDANACSATQTVTVFVNGPIVANITYTDPTCNQSNGSLTLNITQATPPVTVFWSNGPTTFVNNNVPAGLYTCTITDANGCSLTLSQGLSNVGGPTVTTSVVNTGCTNSTNGSITTNVTGSAPFSYLWSTAQTTPSVSGLGAGNYTVAVTDAVGCVTTVSSQVNALNGNLYMYAAWSAAENCGQPTGSVRSYVQGGTMPYSYAWSSGATTPNDSNLLSGTYTLAVTDANGCVASGAVNVPVMCNNIITGRIYYDVNQNSIFDGGDFPYQGHLISAAPNQWYASTDSMGMYTCMINDSGSYTVAWATPYPNLQVTIPAAGTHQVYFPTVGDTASNIDFVLTAPVMFQDLYLSLASGLARPGFPQSYSLYCENRGTTIVSDTIWFRHDTILTLMSATPAFDGYSDPDGYWVFSNFAPGQTISKQILMQVPTIQNGGYIGRQLISNARIEPTSADVTSPDNGDDEIDIIQGSYDPNMKECWSPTMNANGDIWPSDIVLDYTIHFQNTGTDTAFFITVVDTLPAELDVTTFEPGASSHPYTWNISGANDTNIVTFTFMNILLVDSFRNEPMSHGYVQFSIERDPNLPIGTSIENRAGIYFDFNLPVMTNYSIATISNPLTVETGNASSLTIYPNPAQDRVNVLLTGDLVSGNATITLRDISGREIASVNSNGNSNVVLETQGCASGMYFITITSVTHETITQPVIISAQ